MITCPYCGYENRNGILFCESCAQGMDDTISALTLPTKQIIDDPQEMAVRATWGSASLTSGKSVVLHIRDVTEPVELDFNGQYIFGRGDNMNPKQPDFDLTAYGALERGVSRKHAAIERNDDVLTLIDLGSSNGTFLNGQRLVADQPRVLRDGDEVRFGRLVVHVYFK